MNRKGLRFKPKEFMKSTKKQINKTASMFYKNAEGTAILTFSGIGMTSVLSKLPLVLKLPAFINPAVAIPVVSVTAVSGLAYSMSKRRSKKK